MTNNDKYPIQDMMFSGTVFSVSPKIPFKNGEGSFRNVVLKVAGIYDEAYVPFLVFGTDAEVLGENSVGKRFRVTVRLSSRQYTDRTGDIRWNIGLTCRSYVPEEQQADKVPVLPLTTGTQDLPEDPDDIPF